ncbi:endonuclease [Tanacetum coccineum]
MSTQFSVVHREIEDILGSYAFGIPMSHLFWLERSYQEKFNRSLASLDFKSFGVNNIVELLEKLADKKMVVLIDEPEMKEKFVLSARMDLYEDKYKVKLNYHHYGLTNLDDLCEVFKDMLVVEVPDPTTGVKIVATVIRPGYFWFTILLVVNGSGEVMLHAGYTY